MKLPHLIFFSHPEIKSFSFFRISLLFSVCYFTEYSWVTSLGLNSKKIKKKVNWSPSLQFLKNFACFVAILIIFFSTFSLFRLYAEGMFFKPLNLFSISRPDNSTVFLRSCMKNENYQRKKRKRCLEKSKSKSLSTCVLCPVKFLYLPVRWGFVQNNQNVFLI